MVLIASQAEGQIVSQVSTMQIVRLSDKGRGYPILVNTDDGLAFADTVDARGCWSHVVRVRNFRCILGRPWAPWEPVSGCDMYLSSLA